MASHRKTLLAALLAFPALGWAADPVRMDFEGLTQNVGGLRADVAVSDFYNRGSSKVPGSNTVVVNGPATSLGVVFGSGALVTETNAGGNGGQSSVFGLTRNLLLENGSVLSNSSALGRGVLYSGAADFLTLTFASGFNLGLSFFFNSGSDLSVSVLLQDGSALTTADFTLSNTVLCPTGQSRCEWNAASLPFSGTAYGVRFSGAAGDFALDNITLGSLDALTPFPVVDPGGNGGNNGGNNGGGTGGVIDNGGGGVAPIPEPSTYAMMALGLGLVVWAARRRRSPAATAQA